MRNEWSGKVAVFAVLAAMAVGGAAARADDKATEAAQKRQERKKERIEFFKGMRDKRWEFEDSQIKAQRDHMDESIKTRRDAEKKRDDALEAATDPKAEESARKEFRDTMSELEKKNESFKREVDKKREDFRHEQEKERSEYEKKASESRK